MIAHDDLLRRRLRHGEKTKGPLTRPIHHSSLRLLPFFSGPNFNELLQKDSSQKSTWVPSPREAATQGQGLGDKGRADGRRDGRKDRQRALRKAYNLSDKWPLYLSVPARKVNSHYPSSFCWGPNEENERVEEEGEDQGAERAA